MEFLVYQLFRFLRAIFTVLPLKADFAIGSVLGAAAYYLLPPYRTLVVESLTRAFPEKTKPEIRSLAKRHFSTLGANLLSIIKTPSMSPAAIAGHMQIENVDALKREFAAGKGVVAILSHVGNWELLAQIPGVFPMEKLSTVFQPIGNRYLDKAIQIDRARLGVTLFDRRKGFNDPIRFLREGGIVGVLVDQHAGDGGVWTPFFNRLASTSPLAATLAKRTGAALVPVNVYTAGFAQWRVAIGDPLQADSLEPEALTAEINRGFEGHVRVSPQDWFWVHDRWKTPSPNFLLSNYRRGVSFPAGFDPRALAPFRILIRSTNWLGDAVLSVPAVEAIKRGRPDARVTILTNAKLADFWKRVDAVDEVLSIEPGDSLFAVARKLYGKFDVAILFPNSFRSAAETLLARVPRRAGYPGRWRRWLLNELVPSGKKPRKKKTLPLPAEHQVYHYLRLAQHLGADAMPELPPPGQTDQSPDPASPARKWIAAGATALHAFFPGSPAGQQGSGPLKIGLCPGAEYGPAKRWPAERFFEAARLVSERQACEWIIYGTEKDAPAAEEIERALDGHCTNLAGKTTLAELMDSLRQCSALLTNDTGTMHLAAFLRVPVVAIFGSTEPALTGPLGAGHRVIRHQVECSPCFLRDCPIDFRCMTGVEAAKVAEAVLQTLGNTPRVSQQR